MIISSIIIATLITIGVFLCRKIFFEISLTRKYDKLSAMSVYLLIFDRNDIDYDIDFHDDTFHVRTINGTMLFDCDGEFIGKQ